MQGFRHAFAVRPWLVLVVAGALAVAAMLVATVPVAPTRVLSGEVVAFGVGGKHGYRSARVRFASGEERVISLPRGRSCSRGDRVRVFESRRLLDTIFEAAPEGCVRG